jgi:hypothetical protein
LYRYFFPIVPHYDAADSKVEMASLVATVTAVDPASVSIRLRGSLVLRHNPGGKDSDGRVTATLLGFATIDRARRLPRSLELVSEEANFAWTYKGETIPGPFVIAVQWMPAVFPVRTDQRTGEISPRRCSHVRRLDFPSALRSGV